MTRVYETDWLASRPVFYNQTTGKVSNNINNVIDYSNLEFHPEGFNNYLDFGYSILEQTPIKDVKFLRHSSRLIIDDDNHIVVEYLEDTIERWIGKLSHEDDVLHMLELAVRQWEKSVKGEIIIPTSGGYDSRLLNFLIQDKSRIRSFTYGISENQAESYEVVYARKLSEILGTCWEQIELGNFHLYFDDWDRLFGISTHAHGMYHIEFYTKILPKVEKRIPLLSGIIGDAWAGSVNIPEIANSDQLSVLGYTHGLHADSRQSKLRDDIQLKERYFQTIRELIALPFYRVVEAMRFKIILLSYLLVLPESLGFKPWSPFLNKSIALGMATLSPDRRKNRLWQKEFFQKNGLDFESMKLKAFHQNTLDLQALRRIPVKPLDTRILREVVKSDYIEWINRNLPGCFGNWRGETLRKLVHVYKIGGALRRLGYTNRSLKQIAAYSAYLVLLPIQNLLRRRIQT